MSTANRQRLRSSLLAGWLWLAGAGVVVAMASPADWTRPDDAVADRREAQAIALDHIVSIGEGEQLVILGKKTVERPFGWVFFCTTAKYAETGDPGDLVPGFGPLVINRRDGAVEFLPTSLHPDAAIETYQERWATAERNREARN